MAQVQLEHVTKIYPGDIKAVDDVSLTIADREFLVLVGPSGCGKSTTLRMVAGLEDITAGTIRIGDRVVNGVAPKDRDIAMVFQNYALYPHMTVYKNLGFSLMLRRQHAGWGNPVARLIAPARYQKARAERDEIHRRISDTAAVLGIEELLARRPKALSGGQRQRVAVGRAIVRNPKAFLFDEPLSNLDAKLRVEMRAELKRLHRQVQTTTIYVTHDQEEAMTLGDRVVVMKDGVIHQCATPLELYDRPVNRFVAGFVGTPRMNFLDGRIVRDGERLLFDEGSCRLAVGGAHQDRLSGFVDRPITLGIRPEGLAPADGAAPETTLRVTVGVLEPLGDRMDVYVATERNPDLICRIDSRTPLREGQTTDMQVDLDRVHYFEPGAGGLNVSLADDPS
ncbi:MAG: ATP-binding cassette domain-containing protein [Planctomycetes bacterium]|nr:ATP-binding cassette domain-containing protein [Planctomycetota bacterium]